MMLSVVHSIRHNRNPSRGANTSASWKVKSPSNSQEILSIFWNSRIRYRFRKSRPLLVSSPSHLPWLRSLQGLRPSPKPCIIFRTCHFISDELKNNPLSAIREYLFSIFAAVLWRPFIQLQLGDAPCHGDKGPHSRGCTTCKHLYILAQLTETVPLSVFLRQARKTHRRRGMWILVMLAFYNNNRFGCEGILKQNVKGRHVSRHKPCHECHSASKKCPLNHMYIPPQACIMPFTYFTADTMATAAAGEIYGQMGMWSLWTYTSTYLWIRSFRE
jgi:hypothetical protein